MPDPLASTRPLLAFDFGEARLGVAVGYEKTGMVHPLVTLRIKDDQPDWAEVEKLINEWQPVALIVGLPLNMDGSESELSQRANKFKNRLHGRFRLPAYNFDERLSSFEAKGILLERNRGNRNFKAHDVDALAAQIVLQGWLEQLQ